MGTIHYSLFQHHDAVIDVRRANRPGERVDLKGVCLACMPRFLHVEKVLHLLDERALATVASSILRPVTGVQIFQEVDPALHDEGPEFLEWGDLLFHGGPTVADEDIYGPRDSPERAKELSIRLVPSQDSNMSLVKNSNTFAISIPKICAFLPLISSAFAAILRSRQDAPLYAVQPRLGRSREGYLYLSPLATHL